MLMRLLLRGLWSRRAATGFTLLSVTVCFSLLLAVETLRSQARAGFAGTIAGVDLLVGPRGDPVGLLLQAVFHRGSAATGLSWDSYRTIAARPEVAWAVPLALGDSLRGFPVLGTEAGYFEHFRHGAERRLTFAHGGPFTDTTDAVLGAEVARRLGHRLGDPLVISHGLGAVSFSQHAAAPFRVAGILAATGTPVDRTVHVPVDALAAIHTPAANRDHDHDHDHDEQPAPAEQHRHSGERITAMLVGLKQKSRVFTLQRAIDNHRGEALTAVIPGLALQSLWETLGVMERVLLGVSVCAALAGLLGLIGAVLLSLEGRRREMAILRAVGAGPLQIALLLLGEVLLLTVAGAVLALLLVNGLLFAASGSLTTQLGIDIAPRFPTMSEWRLLLLLVATTAAASLLPAWRAYRQTVVDGLSPRL